MIEANKGRVHAGIDNGLDGALAFIYPDGTVELYPTPTLEAGKKRLIDDINVRRLLLRAAAFGSSMHVVFEQGQLQPAFGCKGNFSQGYSFGVLATVMRQNGIPCTAVNPKDWQKEMHLGVRGAGQDTKSASIEACRRLFPQVSLLPSPRCTKPSHDFADALLMAAWGKRHNL